MLYRLHIFTHSNYHKLVFLIDKHLFLSLISNGEIYKNGNRKDKLKGPQTGVKLENTQVLYIPTIQPTIHLRPSDLSFS